METSSTFRQKTGIAMMILFVVMIFSLFRFVVSGWYWEHVALSIASGASIYALTHLSAIEEQWSSMDRPSLSVPGWIRMTLITVLGTLSLYLFFYKALYQSYLYWAGMTWMDIGVKGLVLIASYRLVLTTAGVQTVVLSISKGGGSKATNEG